MPNNSTRRAVSAEVYTCLYMLPDPENMSTAIGNSLLSCIKTDEIYALSFILPVNGRHLWFSLYPHIGQYCHLSLRVARPRKHGYSRWNCVPMLSTSWVISTSGLKDAILEFLRLVRFYNKSDLQIGLLDLGNIVLAVGILSCFYHVYKLR